MEPTARTKGADLPVPAPGIPCIMDSANPAAAFTASTSADKNVLAALKEVEA